MKKYIFSVALLLGLSVGVANAGNLSEPVTVTKVKKTDANLIGHVVCGDEHLSYATVAVKGTTIGTMTDGTGHFQIIDLPVGKHIVVVQMMGYKSVEREIETFSNRTVELKVELEEDALNLDEIVVSADRNAQKRTEASVIVNSLSPELFSTIQSVTLGETLNFTPGLRLENNCQNCGFSQVRMNGMEGPYSQILINNRPIFSGLAGVYGLELIPTNMIEKVEVVRGGGSALFGSNAIAGTVNIMLKDPIKNSYEGGYNYSAIGLGTDGDVAHDHSVNFNGSIVSDDKQSGLSIYGFTRERDNYDANNDSYSEISMLKNLTFGARAFHRFNYRDKLTLDFFAINEDREGGNDFHLPFHERSISESLTHNMKVGSLTYDRFFRESDKLSVYASGQLLDRDSYYGAGQSLSDYGLSEGKTYNVGAQYTTVFGKNSSLVTGVENSGDFLLDQKLGYLDIDSSLVMGDAVHHGNTVVANQSSNTTGVFAQYDQRFGKFKFSLGARYDHYEVIDKEGNNEAKTGNVFSPRVSLMYDILKCLQVRGSYSQGYRAPQIFDEDLHIETSGSRKVIHKNAADLKQETSHSTMLSLDFNKQLGNIYLGFLAEGFYTQLVDAFASDFSDPDANGVVTTTRYNSSGAAVQGVNMELKLKTSKNLSLTSGFTVQKSEYKEGDGDFNEKSFFRTPNTYGFIALDWDFVKNFCLSASGNYTGKMLVPYFGTENPAGELRTSNPFFDAGLKLAYTLDLNSTKVEFSAGIKNIFNSYQSDFDMGEDRDPAYIYGPTLPRTVSFGIKIGNLL